MLRDWACLCLRLTSGAYSRLTVAVTAAGRLHGTQQPSTPRHRSHRVLISLPPLISTSREPRLSLHLPVWLPRSRTAPSFHRACRQNCSHPAAHCGFLLIANEDVPIITLSEDSDWLRLGEKEEEAFAYVSCLSTTEGGEKKKEALGGAN